MATLSAGEFSVEYADSGAGEAVVLIHSSASTAGQWRGQIDAFADRYRLLAPNLFGYGATSPWPQERAQTLDDHVALVEAVAEIADGRIWLVGHSLGGAVALQAALRMGRRVAGLVLIEAIPFYLLRLEGRAEAFAEVRALGDFFLDRMRRGAPEAAAERLIDYWSGAGAWAAMAPERQGATLAMIANNVFEWGAVIDEPTPLAAYRDIAAETVIVTAAGTPRPTREIADMLYRTLPDSRMAEIAAGGHMCPVTRPDLVNAVIAAHFERTGGA